MTVVNEKDTQEVCAAVDRRVREGIEAEVASLKLGIKIRAAVIIVVVLYMSWAIHRISLIDAEFVVSTVQLNVQNGREAFVQEASEELKRSAPTTVRSLRKDLIASVPSLRVDAERAIMRSVDAMAKEIENALTKDVGQLIEDYKTKVDATNPNLSDAEKLNRVVLMLRHEFRTEVSKIANSRANEFAADLNKINKQLNRLREGKNLTPKEKYQRDLIATWHKLAQMKIQKGEIVPAH